MIEYIQKEKGREKGTGDEEKRDGEIPNQADRIRASGNDKRTERSKTGTRWRRKRYLFAMRASAASA